MDAFDSLFNNVNEKETDLGRALRSNDEEYIENYLKQFDTKKDSELFTILNKITVERDLDFDTNSVKYNKYIIDDMLSRNYDCLSSVFTMNLIGDGLSNQQHYDYLVRTIPVGRKNYKDRTKQYLEKDALQMVVKILLCLVYKCRLEVAEDYYDVLVARDKVDEFIEQYKSLFQLPESEVLVKRYIKSTDVKKEFDVIVDKILEFK